MNKRENLGGSRPLVNITVCGKFHYGNYLRRWEREGVINKVYFSHRCTTTLGLSPKSRWNIFVKEYLLGAHVAILREFGLRSMMVVYHLIWQIGLLIVYRPASANIFLLHGNCLCTLRRHVRDTNNIVIGEVVNAHPQVLWDRLATNANKLGVAFPKMPNSARLAIEELDYVDFLLCPSRAVAESFIQKGFPESKIWVIPYGVPSFPRLPRAGRCTAHNIIKVVCIGQVTLRKAQHLLIECLRDQAALFDAKCKLTLIGREDPEYLKKIERIGFRFEHIKHMPHQQLLEILPEFDLLVMPSLEDGFGMTVVEALAVGLPVVVSKYAGVSELIASRGDACVVDPFDSSAMAQAIIKMTKYDRNVRSEEPELPSWDEYATELYSMIRQVQGRSTSDATN